MRETDIRPDELRPEQSKAVEADVKWLIDRQDDFVHVGCPACSSPVAFTIFEKRGFLYDKCKECETIYLSPRPTPQILKKFYIQSKNALHWGRHTFPASEKARSEQIFYPRARRIVEIDKTIGSVLDVGAGYGTFLLSIPIGSYPRRLIALEPNPQQAGICRAKGLEVYEDTIENLQPNLKVDCITAFEVIEHLFAPRDFIMKCHRMLNENSLLVLTCPNVKGFDIATLRTISNSIDHEHLNYFHPESLSLLVKKCGFEIVEVTTPGKLDAELVRKKIINAEYDINNQPFLKTILINRWDTVGEPFQQFLADNTLSSHLWMVARKP